MGASNFYCKLTETVKWKRYCIFTDWYQFICKNLKTIRWRILYVNSSCLGIKTDFTVKQLYTIFTVSIYSICSCKITNFTVKSQHSISTVNIYSKISCKNTEIFNSVLYSFFTYKTQNPIFAITLKQN